MKPGDYQKAKQAQIYNKHRFTKGLSIVDKQEKKIIENYLKKINIEPSSIILDVGTGTGRVLKLLLKFSPSRILALDSSFAMLTILKKTFLKEIKNERIKTIRSASDKMTIQKNSINLVTSLHLFKHLPNIDPTLKEISRVLKKNSFLIFDVLNKNSLVALNLETCYALTENQLRKKVQNNGFKIISIRYLNVFGETIYKILGLRLGELFSLFDQIIVALKIPVGTKMLILAQKK
jgi:ubiquinone/menaquinone biosynthesis C-methylase UbiE